MILDARVPGFPETWTIYHAEWICELPGVVFIDSDQKAWTHLVPDPFSIFGWGKCSHQAKDIKIMAEQRFVIINPIPEADVSSITENKVLENEL